jgi:hypothetical protein
MSASTSASAGELAAATTLQARDPSTGAPLGSVQATAPVSIGELVAEVAKVQPLWALLRV